MKKGFTLAEVLITLSIIGVVAAMTIPTLHININKNVTEAKVMKAYNTLQNAVGLAMADAREDTLWEACSVLGWNTSVSSSCPATNYALCFSKYINGNVTSFKNQTKIGDYTFKPNSSGVNNYIIKTNDGIEFASFKTLIRGKHYSNSETSTAIVATAFDVSFFVDINGFDNEPNQLGKDIFIVLVNTSTGKVFGFGSKQYSDVSVLSSTDFRYSSSGYYLVSSSNETRTAVQILDGNNKKWTGGNCDASGVGDATTCAGSILDNGGKIIYPY